MTTLRRRKTATVRDAQGRKHCSRGDKCLHPDGPWLPVSEFDKTVSASDGHAWSCKACRKGYNIRKRGPHNAARPRICKGCGELCEKPNAQYCEECQLRNARLRKRKMGGYICVTSSDFAYRGSWFSKAEMDQTLQAGYWPEASVFEKISRKHGIAGTYIVIGKQFSAQTLGEYNG